MKYISDNTSYSHGYYCEKMYLCTVIETMTVHERYNNCTTIQPYIETDILVHAYMHYRMSVSIYTM